MLTQIINRIRGGRKTATPTKRGPQIAGRMSETETLLRKVAKRCRARADAHRLVAPKTADFNAIAALEEIASAADRAALSLREPELPLSS